MTKNNNNTGPLEQLLDRISETELDSRRREKYNRLKAEAIRNRKARSRRLFVSLAAASLITVIIVINAVPGKLDGSELYNKFYTPHEFPIEYRGSDDFLEGFKESLILYRDGKIEEAKKNLDPLLVSEENNPDYLLLLSQILMQQKNFSSSIVYLTQVIEFGGSYERTGQWYLALAYLALNKYDRCAEILGSIIENGDPKLSKMARKLRRKIPL